MIKEQAVVIARDESDANRISVRVDRRGACESCQMKSGCGQKLVADSSQRKCIEFDLENEMNAGVGDHVTLAIPEKSFIQASVIMYIVPLLTMIVGAVVGERYLVLGDGGTLILSVIGFLAGLFLARRFALARQNNPDFQPHVVKVDSLGDIVER